MLPAPEFWSALPLGEGDGDEDDELVDLEDDEVDREDAADEVEEDVEGVEDVEDCVGGSGENESDTLGLATLQNCCARLSVFARSSTHCELTQSVMSCTKRVALCDSQ